MDTDRDTRIAQRAYELWQAEGSPEGRHLDHWEAAMREIEDTEGGKAPTRAPDHSPLSDPGSPGGTGGTGGTSRDQDR